MAVEIQLQVNGGGYGPPGDPAFVSAGDSIDARLTDPVGLAQIEWDFIGTNDSAVVKPTLTFSGNPVREIASFTTAGAGPQAYGIRARLRDRTGATFTVTAGIYVNFGNGESPIFIGESFEKDDTHGRVPELNTLLSSALVPITVTSNPPVNVDAAAAAVGASSEVSPFDHKHQVSTAAPSQGIGGGNSAGAAATLARSDHDHTLRETGGPTDLALGAIADGEVLTRSGGTIVGSSALVAAANTVHVQSLSDLPAPAGGVITLAANTSYQFEGAVSIGANELLINSAGTAVRGRGVGDSIIASTTTQVMHCTGVAATVRDVTVVQLSTGFTVLCEATPSGSTSSFTNVNTSGGKFRSRNNSAIVFFGCGLLGDLQFENVHALTNISRCSIGTAGTATSKLELLAGASFTSGMSVIDADLNTIAGDTGLAVVNQSQAAQGIVERARFGTGTPTSNVDQTSDNWRFTSTDAFANSYDQGIAIWDGASTTVNLLAGQVWVDVADGGVTIAYVQASGSERVSLTDTNNGEQTYDGPVAQTRGGAAHVTFERVGGQNVEVEFALAVNNVVDTSTIVRTQSTAVLQTLTIPVHPLLLEPTFTVRLKVRNVDLANPANDIAVPRAVVIVTE